MDWFNLDDLLSKASLPEVATRLGLELKSQRGTYLALCPFHADTRPSLQLFPSDKGGPPHFHCFACNTHGNAIDLVKEVHGVGFEDAVNWLASTFGIQPERRSRVGARNTNPRNKRIHAQAFVEKVYTAVHNASAFAEWSNKRGYSPDFLYALGLRMVPGNRLINALKDLPLNEQLPLADELESMGLIVRIRQGQQNNKMSYFLSLEEQFRDFFFDQRIVIPIRAQDGRIEGYTGRSVNEDTHQIAPKYLLTRGLQKSKYLFNADHAFEILRNGTKSDSNDNTHTLYIVEGFFDAVRLRSLGIAAVALMGTSLSSDQLNALENFADKVIPNTHVLTIRLFLDRDAAGLRASVRAVRQLLHIQGAILQWVGCSDELIRSVGLRVGKDPDECLNEPTLAREAAIDALEKLASTAIATLLLEELGSQDPSDLTDSRWRQLNRYHRDRALFNTVRSLWRLSRTVGSWAERLRELPEQPTWLIELLAALSYRKGSGEDNSSSLPDSLFLTNQTARHNHARLLAYHGSRRGELPCDEPNWLYLEAGASIFSQLMIERLQSNVAYPRPAAPFDAIHLPRKFSTSAENLADPRRKVMPHPIDLMMQQVLINELLTERNDFSHGNGETFSDLIPAVRYYRTERRTRVTGIGWANLEHTATVDEPTLSFAYQIDMEVLEGQRTPSDQGMFRPFGECWKDFMDSISRQTLAIGGQVHVLRLDAKRYYDNICRYIVRDQLLGPLKAARALVGTKFLTDLIGDEKTEPLENRLVDRVCECLFEYEYSDPDTGQITYSSRDMGIPQGPVISAWIGTIVMFSVDAVARELMQRYSRTDPNGRPITRLGYARYVDDIILLADSAELLAVLRQAVQEQASKLALTLVTKGNPISPGTPESIIQHLNEGRNFAASAPTWEPPLIGDGEWGWSLGDDGPELSRQSALRLLRHPGVLDQPDKVHEKVREAMLASDLRPADLGKCTRLLWWQLAMTAPNTLKVEDVWELYWKAWSIVTEGHSWTADFNKVGYSTLAAMEGLDRLFDMDSCLGLGQTQEQVRYQQSNLKQLASLVCQSSFFKSVHVKRNQSHLQRRQELVRWKARRYIEPTAVFIDPQIESTRNRITLEQWFCFATARLIASPKPTQPNESFNPKLVLSPLVERDLEEAQNTLPISTKVRNLLLKPFTDAANPLSLEQLLSDSAENTSTLADQVAGNLALDLLISATPRERLWEMLSLYPSLLSQQDTHNLQVMPPLPGITTGHLLAGVPNESESNVILRAFWMKAEEQITQQPPVKFWGGSQSATVAVEPLPQKWKDPPSRLGSQLLRWEASSPLPVAWPCLITALSKTAGRTHFAAGLFRALYAAQQRVMLETGLELVPVVPHLATRGEGQEREWFVLGEPISSSTLGATAWVRGSSSSLRSVSVPKGYGHLWRIGVAVSDALDLTHDITNAESSESTDDQLPDQNYVEEYVLRQQMHKLRGRWLSEANIRADGTDGLPRSLERALEILEDFPSNTSPAEQVLRLLKTEAETRAMAMRLADQTQNGIRERLHQLPVTLLNRIPLNILEALPLTALCDTISMRADLTAILTIAHNLKKYSAHVSGPADAWSALSCALPLAVATTGLRSLAASLQGLIREPMPEHYILPTSWPEPDASRGDPQTAYAQIRNWLQQDFWPKLLLATPWQWMLAVLGMLHKHIINSDEFSLAAERLEIVYRHLLIWETAESYDSKDMNGWAWPFEDLPKLSDDLLTALNVLLDATPRAVTEVEKALGIVVQNEQAPIYGRNRHDNGFRDARGRYWTLRKTQYTELGQMREGISSIKHNQERLVTWTEVRNRRGDDELLSVHVVDNKLSRWIAMAADSEQMSDNIVAQSDIKEPNITPLFNSAPESIPEQQVPAIQSTTLTSAKNRENSAVEKRRQNSIKKDSYFRVALFQWRVDESYSHPLIEAGLNGFGLKKLQLDQIRESLPADSCLAIAADACQRCSEHLWGSRTEQVQSWPEHRRRRLLISVLEQCKRLKVDLLVLPEYSVRSDTVAWLREQLQHAPGLAVLAGTYRQLDQRHPDDYLKSPLTLLWQPPQTIAKSLLETERPLAFQWKRGKKYRAVAVNELFRPEWATLAPLFTPDTLLKQFKFDSQNFDHTKLSDFSDLLCHQLPPLQYCMELICSELFMLTSPANLRPLQREISELLLRFPTGPQQEGSEIVTEDFHSLAKLLDIGHTHQYPRRSVLLVPSATSRTNDYLYAGQASVLASATATVFCNSVYDKLFKGGSCFIGADSTSRTEEFPGMIDHLTPYHGWSKGIHIGGTGDALSDKDQALVVADLDPVHVVGGKPRPQLLPRPMRLVAYLPVVELLDSERNAHAIKAEMIKAHPTATDIPEQPLKSIQNGKKTIKPEDFKANLKKLEMSINTKNTISNQDKESFAQFFSDPEAVKNRLTSWQNDRAQQPHAGQFEDGLPPALTDFIAVDLTLKEGQNLCSILVPAWTEETSLDFNRNGDDQID